MSSTHHTSDASNSQSSSSELYDSHNFLLRLYAALLNHSLIQTGIRQLTDIAQPLVGKFDNNLDVVKSSISQWVIHENFYNHLATQWLSSNLPGSENIISYEDFALRVQDKSRHTTKHNTESIVRDFYGFASEAWKTLEHSGPEDLKNAMLLITAKVLNKAHGFEDDSLSTALNNMLRMLIEKRRELVSAESYFNLVKLSLGDDFYLRNQKAVRAACDEYYTFAKRFLILDFPLALADKNVLRLVVEFLKDNVLIRGDSTLNFIERQFDFMLRILGEKPQLSTQDNNIVEKTQRIIKKGLILSFFPLRKMEQRLHYAKDTHAFKNLDKYLHVSDRIDDALGLAGWGFRVMNENVLAPTFGMIRFVKDKAMDNVAVIMHGLNPVVIKKNIRRLRVQYKVLKQCTMVLKDGTLKILLDKETRDNLTEDAKKELVRFYQEVKTLERQRISEITMEYYLKVLKKAKRTYGKARKAVLYQDVGAEGQIKAKKVRRVDGEPGEYSESEGSVDGMKSAAVEATA